jgi:NAD(P)H-quinone oxidoreductase subunit 5
MHLFNSFLWIDTLSLIMTILVTFVSISVASFSKRYLGGDRQQKKFYCNLAVLVFTVFIMVSSNNLLLFMTTWAISNLLLVRLMLHKYEWRAARESARLALKNFLLGFCFLSIAFTVLYCQTSQVSIQEILQSSIDRKWLFMSTLCIFLAAMTQSGLFPFHKWLISSLNSPTPVSAIMHAGLINGGGFLLARFAPIFLQQPAILNSIFILSIVTIICGTLWKLMQSDIKRMLACSTMAQMGFMMAQCGMGLFPAAIAHLFWHGLFKAYLFLASGASGQEKRIDLEYPPKTKNFLASLLCGFCGAYAFSIASCKSITTLDTTVFLTVLAMIAATQFALIIVQACSFHLIVIAMIATTIMGGAYGYSVHLIEASVASLHIAKPQPLTAIHVIALLTMLFSWFFILFRDRFITTGKYPDWMLKFYVTMLNASQPHPKTVTTCRNEYQF